MPWSNFTWKINGWNPKSWRFGSDHVPFQLGAFELQNLNFRHQESKAEKKTGQLSLFFSTKKREKLFHCVSEKTLMIVFWEWICSTISPHTLDRIRHLSCRCFRLDLPGRLYYPRRVESLSRKKILVHQCCTPTKFNITSCMTWTHFGGGHETCFRLSQTAQYHGHESTLLVSSFCRDSEFKMPPPVLQLVLVASGASKHKSLWPRLDPSSKNQGFKFK